MDFLYSLFFHTNANEDTNERADKHKPKKTCVLDQGKLLLSRQQQREVALTSDINLMGYEGFTSNSSTTIAKNENELLNTTAMSNNLNTNVARYNNEYPNLIADARAFTKMTNRNAKVNRDFKEHVDLMYDITADKEGCYKHSNKSSLVYQSDIKDVDERTCKNRALDMGYPAFAVKKNATGQLGCYLSKDIEGERAGGLATKDMTSFSFKKSKGANVGGLLMNGQIGSYKDTVNTNMVTDLTAYPGCDIQGGNVFINDTSVIATYGGNCKPPPLIPHFVNTGKRQTWISSETFAQNMGGRLATIQEIRDYINKNGALAPGQDQWVAVTNDGARDWAQIGNTVHKPGISHIKDVKYYPAWGDNISIPTPVANYVFWMASK